MNREDVIKSLAVYEKIRERADAIAEELYGSEYYEFDFEGIDFEDLDNVSYHERASFKVSWEAPACGRGCCGLETRSEFIPLKYLWDDNWWEDHQAREAEKLRKNIEAVRDREEKERKEKLEAARREVERAKEKLATAETDAKEKLLHAEDKLAKLEKAS